MADVKKEIALEVSMADKTSAGTQSAKQRLRELQKDPDRDGFGRSGRNRGFSQNGG